MKKLFVIGMAVLLLVVFTMPAMAKVKIGGIVFTDFYYIDRNKANSGTLGAPAQDTTTYTRIEVPSITRLYARWTNEDNVGMYIEFGLMGGNGDNQASVRHAYGWWDVTPMFQLMAGHTTTPFSPLNPSQLLGTQSGSLNIIGAGYGEFYSGRFPQVRGTFRFGKTVRLEIALCDPFRGTNAAIGQTGTNSSKIPRVDIGVPIYAGPVRIYPSFLYSKKSLDNVIPSGSDSTITTYIGSIGAKAGFGPFGIALEGQWGKNWGNTSGLLGTGAFNNQAVTLARAVLLNNNEIYDAETYGVWIDLSYKFGPVTPHLMYGQMKTKSKTVAQLNTAAKSKMYGFSVPIGLAKGFSIRPEVMWYDNGDLSVDTQQGTDLGKYLIAGVQFQITF